MTRALVLSLAGALAFAPTQAGQSQSARISGVVVTTDVTPQPVRRAIVALSGGSLALSLNAITDDEGRFEINDVPAGRFTVSASRPSYVTVAYGASAPGRAGVPLVVEDGQRLTGIRLQLARGAVIAGTVRDADGAPTPGALVNVAKRQGADAVTMPQSVTTDDRGNYRLFGLAAGEYFIVARTSPAYPASQMQVASSDQIDRALLALARGERSLVDLRRSAPTPAGERPVAITPVWYPSAMSREDATPVTVRGGEERAGADITMRLTPVATLEGLVSLSGTPAGRDWLSNVHVSLYPATAGVVAPVVLESPSRENGGRFRYGRVTPGTYFVVADTMSAGMRTLLAATPAPQGTASARAEYQWAADTVVTSGTDVAGVALVLAPGLRMHGRIAFDSATGPRPDARAARVGVTATWPGRGRAANTRLAQDVQFPIAVGADGSFDITDLPAAAYSFTCTMPSSAPGRGWWLRSAIIDGTDILDDPWVLDPSAPAPTVVLTLTDRHSSLSGAFQDATGRPTSDITVVVLPTNPAWWGETSRRVRIQRPGTDGTYAFLDMPAGDYVLAAVTDMEPDEWKDPAFLRALVADGVRVTITEGEQKRQDLRIGR